MGTENPIDQLGKDLAADHTLEKAIAGSEEQNPHEVEEPAEERAPMFIGEYESFDDVRLEMQPEPGDMTVVNGSLVKYLHDGTFAIVLQDLVGHYTPNDHTEEFSAELEGMYQLVERAEFESGTVMDRLRNMMIDLFKKRPRQWSQLSKGEQAELTKKVEEQLRPIIQMIVRLTAEGDEISVLGKLEKYTHGNTMDLKITAHSDRDAALALFDMVGHEVMIRSVDSTQYTTTSVPTKLDEDMEDMFADGAREQEEQPAPPADDSDLAGDADEDLIEEDTINPDDVTVPENTNAAAKATLADIDGPNDYESRQNPDDFTEATEEELAAQAGRNEEKPKVYEPKTKKDKDALYRGPVAPTDALLGESWFDTSTGKTKYHHPGGKWYVSKYEAPKEEEPAPGTGASAIAAMKAADAEARANAAPADDDDTPPDEDLPED